MTSDCKQYVTHSQREADQVLGCLYKSLTTAGLLCKTAGSLLCSFYSQDVPPCEREGGETPNAQVEGRRGGGGRPSSRTQQKHTCTHSAQMPAGSDTEHKQWRTFREDRCTETAGCRRSGQMITNYKKHSPNGSDLLRLVACIKQ